VNTTTATETPTSCYRLTGHTAINFAAARGGLSLSKFADPVDGERDDLTISEARKIASEDAALIYLDYEPSPNDIRTLGTEAGAAGDTEMVRICERAWTMGGGDRRKVAKAIIDAWAASV
jgi:hypothetical protein